MSIRTNIEGVMEQIANGNTTLGQQVREKAIAAIIGGQGSPAWETYMEQFSTTSEQMARLLPTDSTENDPGFDEARTYLIGNGTCGSDTTGGRLIEGVGDKLDEEHP
jgi:hypothetical protein